ncbi:hypothetical protein CRG98_016837 [Punica granatum]|uniref:Reverse transcriptase zinc-binding domain-containing protein n=1 Tax=Punica granatum TaxID=22663 RepID=A0A2I0K2I8_PUNGR|nr:hypothetical protein CRG98_016837 [Punica granatum]
MGGLGIPNMDNHNKALLGNLVFKASTSHDPWACLLRHQFATSNPTRLRRGSSNWKAITVGMDVWNKGDKWLIGNGESASFWNDHWIGDSPLKCLIQGPLPAQEELRLGSSVLSRQRTWDFSSIPFELPKAIRDSIQGLPIGLRHDIPDSII